MNEPICFMKAGGEKTLRLFTIGHSNYSFEEFLSLLRAFEIRVVVDIRRYPSSRKFQHFNGEVLRQLQRVGKQAHPVKKKGQPAYGPEDHLPHRTVLTGLFAGSFSKRGLPEATRNAFLSRNSVRALRARPVWVGARLPAVASLSAITYLGQVGSPELTAAQALRQDVMDSIEMSRRVKHNCTA